MTKSLKRIFVCIISALAFAFAGLFFVGCDSDNSNVTVTSDVASLELEIGESQDITFTINNASGSFVNTLKFNQDSAGIVEIGTPQYNENVVRVSVTALKGGVTNLMAVTEDGYKYTSVHVSVIQHSSTLGFDESNLYVSNTTSLKMNNGYYNFDSNTTDKEMSFYYLLEDVTNMSFSRFTDEGLEFVDNDTTRIKIVQAVEFDTIRISEDKTEFILSLGGVDLETRYPIVENFDILSVYDYSVNYSSYLSYIHTVQVLQDLGVKVYGGYLVSNQDGSDVVEFNELTGDEILIIPNSNDYTANAYILKIEAQNKSDLIEYGFTAENNNIDVDEYQMVEEGVDYSTKTIVYYKIQSSVFGNVNVNLDVYMRYSTTKDVKDESVNFTKSFDINVDVAPKEILVNGEQASQYSSQDNPLILYNRYTYPEFGWQDMLVSVTSGADAEPIFSYAYIEFEETDLRFKYGQIEISSGRRITDLSTAFQFKGKDNAAVTALGEVKSFRINVTYDTLGNEITLSYTVYYRIVNGATRISKNAEYGQGDVLYLDHEDTSNASVIFDNYLFADELFQSFTTEFVSGADVVDFEVMSPCYIERDGNFYLNFKVNSSGVGQGTYKITLDNGTSQQITFSVIDTIKQHSTSVNISNIGNVSYYERAKSSPDLGYYDVLNLEILNPTVNNNEQYEISFGSTAEITFNGNITTTTATIDTVGVINFLNFNVTSYHFETQKNGVASMNFTVYGYSVNELYQQELDYLEFTINFVSYSLLSEFVFLNNGNYAVDNIVYYGDSDYIPEEDEQVDFEVQAESKDAYNFYRYSMNESFFVNNGMIQTIIDDRLIGGDVGSFSVEESDLTSSLVAETYDNKFIYYYVDSTTFNMALTTTTNANISVNIDNQTFYNATVELSFNNGFMFFADDMNFVYNADENISVTITFTNIFKIANFGEYDLRTLVYTNLSSNYVSSGTTFTLHAYVRQRDYSQMRYDANIIASSYVQVEDVSSASPLDELVFTNSELVQSFVVYVTPTTATNTTLRAEFVPVNNASSNLVNCTIIEQGLGTYLIEISAERFYNSTPNITDITETLAGTCYIYPIEWGDSYSVIPTGNNPIIVDVSYRNGSENNRYILETPADVLAINSNEKSLSSHYEIKNLIDMSTVSGTPIGILSTSEGYELVGFSGSIVGTSSQAGIANLRLTTNAQPGSISHLKPNDDTYYYSGLFAKINSGAYIKNLTISGSVSVDVTENEYVGLLAGVNYGKISNVSARVTDTSNVYINSSSNVHIGGLVGGNYNQIIQYFPAYADVEFTGDAHKIDDVQGEFAGQSTKNIAYYLDKMTISLPNDFSGRLYAGGIAGFNSGDITKVDDASLKIYGYSTYSCYANIEITANSTISGNIYAGGAVGYAVSDITRGVATLIQGLTVGGEVDFSATTMNNTSAVGGIVGFATIGLTGEGNTQEVHIYDNISRTFVRGELYVGGILGFDNYQQYNANSNGSYVLFAPSGDTNSKNRIEAVDDGRNVLEASMMILRYNGTKLDNLQYDESCYIGIGNARDSGRNLGGVTFETISYVTRTPATGDEVMPNDNAITKYYADYLVLNGNTIKEKKDFTKQEVNLNLSDNGFRLTPKTEIENPLYVFLSYYFEADSFLSGQGESVVAQDVVDEFNTYTTSSALYPFTTNTRDAEIISSSTDILSVDVNGNITTLGTGLATLRLQSILNVQKTVDIYLYIVNYFNKDTKASIYYSSANSNGLNIVNGSQINVYGNKQTSIYAVPTYEKDEETLQNGNTWSISKDGILRYSNTSVLLARNTTLKTDVTPSSGGVYTRYQINGDQIIFYGNNNGEGKDDYNLTSYVAVEINGVTYLMNVGQQNVDIDVQYLETATDIYTSSNLISMQTNDKFEDTLYIESKNTEYAYYQIVFTDENKNERVVQSRLDSSLISDETSWKNYVNVISGDDLFNLTFNRVGNSNTFTFNISINKQSQAYINRNTNNIFGNYRIIFYGNELQDGVSCNYEINLSEAELTNVSAFNYSNIKDMSVADEVIIPSQFGILEINIDPVEAEFDTFTISNNSINNNTGAGEVVFTFAYQSVDETGAVTYVADTNFGVVNNGALTFTYSQLMEFLTEKGESYNGKVYIRYFLASNGVEDGAQIAFDINVTYGEGLSFDVSVPLTVKLANYVKLTFDNREESDTYYVARGLNYGMTLEYYGFSLDDIQISVSNSNIATLTGQNTTYSLNVTSNEIDYTGDVGYLLNIFIYASRVVDNVPVEFSDTLTVYVMEYVFNYNYVQGVNEDIVDGMEDGVISTAVGNAYPLQLDIWDFMEYDSSNDSVVQNVQSFITRLMQNVTFSITDLSTGGEERTLAEGTEIRSNYYYINGYTFTGIRLYEPTQNIYNLSVSGEYAMLNGVYICGEISSTLEKQTLLTNFSFSIHQQSTDESPLPVEDYEDLMSMEDGEYYILLNDIILPNEDSLDYDQFMPIQTAVAGFDGNGYTIFFGGDYHFDAETTAVGLFSNIGSTSNNDVVIKNVTIEIYANTNFIMDATTFSIGVLAANNSGIITNSEVKTTNNSVLSVTYRNTTSNSYLAGLVASNSGIITNSRTIVDMYTNVNLAGFVGTNSGTISSSYFRNGSLKNETNTTTEYTAGFALQNSGSIYTSYVSGEADDEVFYKGKNDFIQSDNTIAGFVFSNSGLVENCYTNINMQGAGSFSAGFVFTNSEEGIIKTSYSTSVLTSNNTQSYGFAGASSGTISDCFWLSDETAEVAVGETGVNVSISTIENNENNTLRSLTVNDFKQDSANFVETFKNFIYSNSRGYNSVWFYNSANTTSTFNGSSFNTNRLELVAPNIVAFSQKYLYSAEEVVDEETGVTTVIYHYVNTEKSGITGSAYNPILLDSAENFEQYILNENDANNYNSSYYRLINNIDYNDLTGNSELYKTRFMGYLEGNYLTISNMSIVTSENLQFAGMFAEVGSSSRANAIGTLLNFTLQPSEMVFTNSQVVGAVAGKLDGGTIANVNVLSDDNIMITGKNVVGGIIGLGKGNYKISNVKSDLSAKASYIAEESDNNYNDESVVYQYYSFAGGVMGVASGSGVIDRAIVESNVGVVGAKAGGLFGLIDNNVSAKRLTLNVTENLSINAYNYGGLVVGESAGNLQEVNVNGYSNGSSGYTYMQIFSTLPYVPSAVGGVAGLISGGTLNEISVSQSLNLSKETSVTGINSIGGIAGMLTGRTEISNVDVTAGLIGFHIVGGLIGTVQGNNFDVIMNNINFNNGYLSILSTQHTNAYVGGVIGYANGSVNISISADLPENVLSEAQTAFNGHYVYTDTSNPPFTSLSTDIFISDNYKNEANNINFSVSVVTYVYGTAFSTYIGEIVGAMTSGMISVDNSISTMTGTVSNLDMGTANATRVTETLSISSTAFNYSVGEQNYTGNGFRYASTTTGTGGNSIAYNNDTSGYTKGSFAGEIETTGEGVSQVNNVKSLIPIFNQKLTYNYNSGGNYSYSLVVNNIGVCVGDSLLPINS